jgi:hypothetical protein
MSSLDQQPPMGGRTTEPINRYAPAGRQKPRTRPIRTRTGTG